MRAPWAALSSDRLYQLGFALAALCLGAYGLGDKGLWVDEAVSLRFALSPASRWFADNNMALFYALLSPIVGVFGDSERALRGLSVAAFALSAPLFYALLARAFDVRVARIGGALFVANGYLLHFAQEARGYMLAVLLVNGASFALFRLASDARPGWALAYGALIGLALYAHAFALWVLLAHGLAGLWLALRERTTRRPLLLAFALASGAAGPLVLRALSAGTTQISWLRPPTLASCLAMAELFAGGSRLCALALLALALAFVASGRRALASAPLERAFAYVLVATWFFVPVSATLLVAHFVTPIVHPKYLLISLPALLAAAAVVVASLRAPALRTLLVCALLALSLWGELVYYRDYQKERWREAVALLAARMEDGDALVLDLSAPEPFDYYALRTALPTPLHPDRAFSVTWGEVREHTDQERGARFASAGRIWLVQNRGSDVELYEQIVRTHRPSSRLALEPHDGDARGLFADPEGRVIRIETFLSVPR